MVQAGRAGAARLQRRGRVLHRAGAVPARRWPEPGAGPAAAARLRAGAGSAPLRVRPKSGAGVRLGRPLLVAGHGAGLVRRRPTDGQHHPRSEHHSEPARSGAALGLPHRPARRAQRSRSVRRQAGLRRARLAADRGAAARPGPAGQRRLSAGRRTGPPRQGLADHAAAGRRRTADRQLAIAGRTAPMPARSAQPTGACCAAG